MTPNQKFWGHIVTYHHSRIVAISLRDEKMNLLSIYTVIFGPFWTQQEIHERGVVEENSTDIFALVYFKKGVERAEVNADIPIFQSKHKLNKPEGIFLTAFDQNIVQT